jgi:hypothetical protein
MKKTDKVEHDIVFPIKSILEKQKSMQIHKEPHAVFSFY